VLTPDAAQGGADLANGAANLHRGQDRRHHVRAPLRRRDYFGDRGGCGSVISPGTERLQFGDLFPLAGWINAGNGRRLDLFVDESIHAHDHALATLHLALVGVGRILNRALRESRGNSGDHAAEPVNLGDEGEGVALHLIGERLHGVAATERIDRSCDAGLMGKHLLGAQREAR